MRFWIFARVQNLVVVYEAVKDKTVMKAIIKGKKELGLEITDVPVPNLGPNDVLIKVKAAGICGSDLPIYFWNDPWTCNVIKSDQIIGHEFCGTVVELGGAVSSVKLGELVTAEGHIFCGECFHCKTGQSHICPNNKLVGFDYPGAFAEFICLPEQNIIHLNDTRVDIGALLDPFGNVVHACSKVDLSGAFVMITGCGPLGLMTILLSRYFNAEKIIATDISAYRRDLAYQLGADLVIDPNKPDFLDAVDTIFLSRLGADVLVEMSGDPDAISQNIKKIRPGGICSLVGLPKTDVSVDLANDIIAKGITLYGIIGREIFKTWDAASKIAPIIGIDKIITHRFKFDDFDKAFGLLASGNAGKILLFPTNESLQGS